MSYLSQEALERIKEYTEKDKRQFKELEHNFREFESNEKEYYGKYISIFTDEKKIDLIRRWFKLTFYNRKC